jgi:hypothetical protein
MTYREQFNAIMHYGEFDRMPVLHWTGWPETIERWEREGMPAGVDQCAYFNAHPMAAGLPVNLGLLPLFDEETLEDTDEYRIFRQNDGVVCKDWKHRSCIPHYTDFLLKDSSNWHLYKAKLQPDPARIGDIGASMAWARDKGYPVSFHTASMVGFLRNWMGVENFGVACCVEPDFIAEVCDTIANLVCWTIEEVCSKHDVTIDLGWGWEDICFRSGPLVPPAVFKDAAVPGYRKISDTLLRHGCKLHLVDCDGMIEDLVPLWLEGGVNVMFPIEIGAWNADPAAFRRQYGKELRVLGGIDKLVLEKDPAAIDAEIARRIPLMAEGGVIPLPDHLITPDTPLENYKYYLEAIRKLRF